MGYWCSNNIFNRVVRMHINEYCRSKSSNEVIYHKYIYNHLFSCHQLWNQSVARFLVMGHPVSGGVTNPISIAPYFFSSFSMLWKDGLFVNCDVLFWQHRQRWKWYGYYNLYVCNIRNIHNGQIDEIIFMNPQPWSSHHRDAWCRIVTLSSCVPEGVPRCLW